jgi:transposase
VGVDPRQKVTCGEAVVANVLNALGFVDRPLYLFPEFMGTKPVEMLIREDLKAEDFNDDVLGRTLDKLYRADPREYSCWLPPMLTGHTRGGTFITTPPQ